MLGYEPDSTGTIQGPVVEFCDYCNENAAVRVTGNFVASLATSSLLKVTLLYGVTWSGYFTYLRFFAVYVIIYLSLPLLSLSLTTLFIYIFSFS